MSLFCVLVSAVLTAEPRYDVVVYGGTSGGIAAAVQVARMGKSVVLVEPGRHLGGLTSGGLGATDIGNKAAIGGIAREFYHRAYLHYQQPDAWRQEKPTEYRSTRKTMADTDTMWTFEPHVATRIYRQMLEEAKVPVVLSERLDLAAGVTLRDGRIASIRMESGRVFAGTMFIDATYEGDLMAKAGVRYTVGREANAEFNETLNGVQVANARHHQFVKPVDPFVRPGDRASGLLPGVQAGPPGEDGQGDRRVQAYNFRMCTTDVPENRRAWPKPEGYDPQRYELLLRNFEAGDHRVPWNPVWMPNRKTDTNNNFAISTDNIGMNYDYPDADYARRAEIVDEHRRYQQGLMWTLANDPRVPHAVREKFQTLGLAKDEFTDNDNWPHQLYVREARRMRSDYVMTEHNCRGTESAPQPVGLAAYTMDSHNTQRYVDADGHARNEGDVQVGGFSPYTIAYKSIVPAAGQCANLAVPICVSATHIAYGSIRMEPVFMVLGQSAATAAVQAIEAGVAIQDVDYAALRARLLADKQVLEWTGPKRIPGRTVLSTKLPGIVVDDQQAKLDGEWRSGASVHPFVDAGYQHDGAEEKAGKRATFEAKLPADGRYEVRFAYTPLGNRSPDAKVVVRAADGEHTVKIDQREKPPIDELFLSLGVFAFKAAAPAAVVVEAAGTRGHVIIDAVQFLPQPPQ